jgi:3-oxoacyl-[acyl-carrier protein] reductase
MAADAVNVGKIRTRVAIGLAALSGVLLAASVVAVWSRNQILNTDSYVKTVAPMIEDSAIQREIVDNITEAVMSIADIEQRLNGVLPDSLAVLSETVDESFSVVVRERATDMVRSDEMALLWREVNRAAHEAVKADFSDLDATERVAHETAARLGAVHILVNNTGGPAAGTAIEAKPRDYVNALAMHLGCAQAWTQACAPLMRAAGYGRIINVTSTSVFTPIKGLGVSNSVRAAMANWTKTLAGELGRFGITVNNVMPGFTKTARLEALFKGKASRGGTTVDEVERDAIATIPAGRLGDARELARAIVFLASPAASYVNGVNLPVDGGRLAAQ